MLKSVFKNALLWAISLLIVILGLATIFVCISQFKYLKNTQYSFLDDNEKIVYPKLSLDSLSNHSFQHYIEEWCKKKLRWRNFFITTNNQIYYSLFKESVIENNNIIIGKYNQLFEKTYINAYCYPGTYKFNDLESLKNWADKLQELSHFFETQHKTFIYLISPSKAEYMPDMVPTRFHCKNVGISSHILTMKKLLDERGVRYIDGATLMVKETQQYHLPMFPQGGIHWNALGSIAAVNAIINTINVDGNFHVSPIKFTFNMISNMAPNVFSSDNDLQNLINIKKRFYYDVPVLRYKPSYSSQYSITIIGGSFNWNLLDIFNENNTFKKMNFYYYFKSTKRVYANHHFTDMHNIDPYKASVLKSILASDIIILEENSSLTISKHGEQFYNLLSPGLHRTI